MQDENSQIRLSLSDILMGWQPVALKWQEVAFNHYCAGIYLVRFFWSPYFLSLSGFHKCFLLFNKN